MALQNLTANQIPAIEALLADTFGAALYNDPVYVKMPNTLVGLAEKQRVSVTPIQATNNAKQCEGYTANFVYQSDATLPTISGTAVNQSCTIADGEALTGVAVSFANNWFNIQSANYDNDLCDNFFRGEEDMLRAAVLAHLSHRKTISLNQDVLTKVNANKQTATYASEVGVISAGDIYISDLNLWTPKNFGSNLLPYFDDIAEHENLPDDYLIVGGSILANAANLADYIRLNDDQRAEGAIMDAYADKMVIDRRGFADASLANSIFLVDPRVYGIYLNHIYTDEMVKKEYRGGITQEFRLPLVYFQSGAKGVEATIAPIMYRSGGQMLQAYSDIRHQVVCDTNNGQGYVTDKFVFENTNTGGLLFAPNNGSGRTGIVKITKGTP